MMPERDNIFAAHQGDRKADRSIGTRPAGAKDGLAARLVEVGGAHASSVFFFLAGSDPVVQTLQTGYVLGICGDVLGYGNPIVCVIFLRVRCALGK